MLQLLFFVIVLSDPTALSMFVISGFTPLFIFLVLVLMSRVLKRIEKLEKIEEKAEVPQPPSF